MSRYRTRMDGEWFHIPRHGHLIACCDCGLVHLLKSRLRARKIEIQATRKPKNTAGRRRRKVPLAQRIEHRPSKPGVAGSNPAGRAR